MLHTAHGMVETPVFMPVGTQATVKGVTQRDLAGELDAKIILGNTYHLFLRPGHELIRQMGGLHRFMSWPRAILTDSGGFQVFSLSELRKITEEGVLFRSHLNGDAHLFTPESTVDVQLAFGSDILMALDECPPYPVSHEVAAEAMQRTVRWARRGFQHYADTGGPVAAASGAVSHRPGVDVSGSARGVRPAPDRAGRARLRHRRSVGGRAAAAEPGDHGRSPPRCCRGTSPRYVMGVGMPEELPEYVARGIDMMDCVLPSRNARNGYLFTSAGRVIIKQARYRDDPAPVDRALRLLHLPNVSAAPICAICSRPARCFLLPWLRCTI